MTEIAGTRAEREANPPDQPVQLRRLSVQTQRGNAGARAAPNQKPVQSSRLSRSAGRPGRARTMPPSGGWTMTAPWCVTTDFFTPVVDDAYDYGAIAAANSLSDVYAMGGQPFLALNIAALPPDLPRRSARRDPARRRGESPRGRGGDRRRAHRPGQGTQIRAGGDRLCRSAQMLTKGGVRPGDRLVLTKPLGFGVTTTALKREIASPEDVAEVVGWMKRLNRDAGRAGSPNSSCAAGRISPVTACSGTGGDGAGLRGGAALPFQQMPFVSCARKYAEQWTFPGGATDNRLYFRAGRALRSRP